MAASRSFAATVWSRLQLLGCAEVGRSPSVVGRIWIHGPGRVLVGDRVVFDASSAPIELHAGPGAEIVIGDDVQVAGGTSIEAQSSVTIGERCRIQAYSKILDNHFHPLRGDRSVRPASTPVIIESDVTLGRRAIVLPGARVRRGTNVLAVSVVRGPPASPVVAFPGASGAIAPRGDRSPLLRALAVARDDPADGMRRLLAILRARWLFRNCEHGRRPYAAGHVRVVNHGRVLIGERAAFVGGMIPAELVCHPQATLAVGERSVFNYGASIEAHASIRIGRRCMLASFVRISDIGPEGVAAIDIGDDVWIAHGVTIGEGSVVSAGSVVTRNAPPHSLVAGNPARCLSLGLVAPKPDLPVRLA
jgi:acetyltransferase-like isoleucine patch superfamily enzyme